MTSWIDRINRAIVSRIKAKQKTGPELVPWPEGLELPDGTMLEYAHITSAAAFKTDDFVGDTMCLALEFREGRSLVINERQPFWPDVLAALDANPRRRYASPEWLLRVVSAEEPIEILR